MAPSTRKKLTPKSAILVKKYQRPIRIVFVSVVATLCLLFLLHTPPSRHAGLESKTGEKHSSIANNITPIDPQTLQKPHADKVQKVEYPVNDGKREKAAFVTLARNSDLWELASSIRHVEDRFNRRFHYDWVFLNDKPFDDEFIRVTSALTSGKTKYGHISPKHWSVPDWIDEDKAAKGRQKMIDDKVIYGDSVPYRHMCRFESGFFFQNELLNDYEYYWRVEPEIRLFCDIHYDVFKFMRLNKKKYGFILSMSEYEQTIPTLWKTTKEFIKKYPKYVKENNLMDFISDDQGETYNMCHFWSNFEIGSLDFWRSDAYQAYFNYLDQAGGFFYERWGDAPVHSIAAALFLDKSEVHFFDGVGYYHPNFYSCPAEENIRIQNQCVCNPADDNTWWDYFFCTRKYFEAQKFPLPPGVKEV
ncbi:LANO_0E09296g1_1 [Lachancea nothofagi CBS 11611]|uniref:LANO_0E09296g1_1 n=1 Tax=Lachancea nothofagi CBS 11611 TaxID=1266666 RepID=A0A1G4JVR2_9SACH|nr:LANO_0E09296g1_1 [Lachancea nothofagi CBS 11611]